MKIENQLARGTANTTENFLKNESKLTIGSDIKGQVIKIDGGMALVKLNNEKEVTVKSDDLTQNDVGKLIEFNVKNVTDDGVFTLEKKGEVVLKDGLNPNTKNNNLVNNIEFELSNKLKSVDVEINELNRDILNELNKNEISVNKNLFADIKNLLAKFKNLSLDKAVYITANKIEVKEDNINSLVELVDNKLKIGKSVNNLFDLIKQIDEPRVHEVIVHKLQLKNQLKTDLTKLGELYLNEVNEYNKSNEDQKVNSTLPKVEILKKAMSDSAPDNFLKSSIILNKDLNYENENYIEKLPNKIIKPDQIADKLANNQAQSLETLRNLKMDNAIHQKSIDKPVILKVLQEDKNAQLNNLTIDNQNYENKPLKELKNSILYDPSAQKYLNELIDDIQNLMKNIPIKDQSLPENIKEKIINFIEIKSNNSSIANNNKEYLNEFLNIIKKQKVEFFSLNNIKMNMRKALVDNTLVVDNLKLSKLDLNKLDLNKLDLNKLDLNKLDLNKLDLNKLDLNKLDLNKLDLNNLELDKLDLDNLDLNKNKRIDFNILENRLKSLFIDPKKSFNKHDIGLIYKELYLDLEIIKKAFNEVNTVNSEDIIKQIENLQSNIKFINEVSSNSYYLQIPLNLFAKETTGELFILKKDKKRKKLDPENIAMLISLDTDNIGQVDSLINIDKKNISINMMLENPEVARYVKSTYKNLYETFVNIGYRLVDFKCRVREQDINIINAKEFVKRELDKNTNKSIDYRL